MLKKPPIPEIVFKKGKEEVVSGCYLKHGDSFSIEILPDANFAADFPLEANYLFNIIELFSQYGGAPPQRTSAVCLNGRTYNKVSLPVPSICFDDSGNKKMIYDFSIMRRSSTGKHCPVQLENWNSSFTFVVKR